VQHIGSFLATSTYYLSTTFSWNEILSHELKKINYLQALSILLGVDMNLVLCNRYLPTKRNKLMNLYNSKVDALLHDIVNGRRKALQKGEMSNYSNEDILGRMLAVATDGWDKSVQEFNMASVFNHFKLFYFAGQDTAANLLAFAMQMLALHPEWQERARVEVLEVLGEEQSWSASALSHLKVVSMLIFGFISIPHFNVFLKNNNQIFGHLSLK